MRRIPARTIRCIHNRSCHYRLLVKNARAIYLTPVALARLAHLVAAAVAAARSDRTVRVTRVAACARKHVAVAHVARDACVADGQLFVAAGAAVGLRAATDRR